MRQCDRFAGIILGFFVFHQANAGELTCTGPFASDTTQKRLAKVFGKTNVVREWMRDEGIAIPASVIFPNDPLRRVEVVWWNSKARRWPSSIHSSSANWSAPSGIRVGMSLEQIARINGRSFTLYGFDRPSGGRAVDWKGGTLAHNSRGCNLIVIFAADENGDEADRRRVASDEEFDSDDQKMRAVRPRVKTIGIAYPQHP